MRKYRGKKENWQDKAVQGVMGILGWGYRRCWFWSVEHRADVSWRMESKGLDRRAAMAEVAREFKLARKGARRAAQYAGLTQA